MATRFLSAILVVGLAACERSSEASEATVDTATVVMLQDSEPTTRSANAAPAATSERTLYASRQFSMAMLQAISSRTARARDSFSATVMADVRDVTGRVVLPASSLVSGMIAEVSAASGRHRAGTLTLTVNGVTVRGIHYPLTARIDSLVAGAIIGQVITKDTQGTVIGAAAGAVTGGVSAAATKARDVRLPEGSQVIVTLTLPLTISGS